MKKLLIAALVCAVSMSMLWVGHAAAKPVKLITVMPGTESESFQDVLELVNARLREELNIEIEASWSPWDQYWQKTKLLLSSGEQIDFMWDGIGNLSKYVSIETAMDMTELLKTDGQNIMRMIPERNFIATTIDGKVYGIPSSYASASEKFKSVLIRQDLLEAVGMSKIESVADLGKFSDLLLEKMPGKVPCALMGQRMLLREFYKNNEMFLNEDMLIMINEADPDDNTVYAYEDSDYFKWYSALMYEWVQKGYMKEEVLSKGGEYLARIMSGNYGFTIGAIARPMENIDGLLANEPTGRFAEYLINPSAPRYIVAPGNEVLLIPYTSKHPKEAMQFLNWVYADKANYLLALYGQEGKHYNIENGRIVKTTTDTYFYEWMYRNLNYMEFPTSVSDEFIADFKAWDDGAQLSKTFGFIFDRQPVETELAQLTTVLTELMDPIAKGFVKYEDGIGALKEGLAAAGIDKIRAEYQKQFTAHMANK